MRAQVLLLRKLVLDDPQRAGPRFDRDGLLDLDQDVRIHVLDLDRDDVAGIRELLDCVCVFERARDVPVMRGDLLCGRAGRVEDVGLDVEAVRCFGEQAAELAEDAHFSPVHD